MITLSGTQWQWIYAIVSVVVTYLLTTRKDNKSEVNAELKELHNQINEVKDMADVYKEKWLDAEKDNKKLRSIITELRKKITEDKSHE